MATSKSAPRVVANPGSGSDQSSLQTVRMSVGNIHSSPPPATKTSGIVVRGGKAQTKGKIARGPMA